MSHFLNFNPFSSTRSWLWQAIIGDLSIYAQTILSTSMMEGRRQMLVATKSLLFHSRLTVSVNKIHASPKYQIHTCQGHANFSCIIPIPNHCNTQPSRDEQLLVTWSGPWPGRLGKLSVWMTFQNLPCQMAMSVDVQTCTIGTGSEIPSLWFVS